MHLNSRQKKQRVLMMVFGAFAIFFTGYPHIWSLYQPYIRELTGWTEGQTSMCFYLSMLTFVFGNILGGRIQDKYNPKIAIAAGGGIFAAGILLSAFLIIPSPLPMYFTYGVMQGFGQGMMYTTILSTAQKWFPNKLGFASGIVVTANGLCGFFLAPVSRMILAESGPKTAFLVIGSVIALSWVLGCIFIKNPKQAGVRPLNQPGWVADGTAALKLQKQYTSKEMIRTRKFYYLVATMLFGLISYFMISPVAQGVQTERGISVSIAVSAVMFGSIMNASARLFLPSIADKIGRVKCVKGVLTVSVAAMVMLVLSKSVFTTIAIVLMYGCYGGIMGSFPSLTSSIFGLAHSGENYGFVMSGIVIATLGAPFVANLIIANGFDTNMGFIVGIICAALSVMFIILLERELADKSTGKNLENDEEKEPARVITAK
ncbi:MFS transporter [Robinsoniella peoriensis]|uniref:MFS transporter n=1 Tax=Robinsoniella peoriensis TaxID=180332 RepID=UPI00363000EA